MTNFVYYKMVKQLITYFMETQINKATTDKIKVSTLPKITPFLWFDNQAEQAVNFYTSIFKNSKIKGIIRYGEEGPGATGRPEGSVMTVDFQI